MTNFKGKKVGILGLGIEGLSSARFLVQNGAKVTVLDQKTEKDLDQEMLGEIKKLDVKLILGEEYLQNLTDYDVLVRSPGIKRGLPEIKEAEKNGVTITSQIKIFFDLCPAKIIGVTGTKGKGTTCSLIYEMLKSQGLDVYLGGNIGNSSLEFLNKLNDQSWVVLELSSFQLLDLDKSPHVAVVLMITSEHLDYHKDTKEYIDAKRNILRFQNSSDFAIINRDYPASNESDIHTGAKMFFVSRERDMDEGCFVKDRKIILSMDKGVGFAARMVKRKTSDVNDTSPAPERYGTSSDTENVKLETIIDTKDILLPGKHNWENVCAAVMAVTLAGVSKENIVSVLKTFKGLVHRLELVSEIDGVKYYDDSFSTTPETTIAAIEAFEQPEILILGGSSKNSDFTELGQVISNSKNIKAIIGIGQEWEKIKSNFQLSTLNFQLIEGCKNMREVVVSAALEAEPGDVIILTPACASFGMFKNYKDRGEQFKKEVKELKIRNSNIEIRNKL